MIMVLTKAAFFHRPAITEGEVMGRVQWLRTHDLNESYQEPRRQDRKKGKLCHTRQRKKRSGHKQVKPTQFFQTSPEKVC